MSDDQEQPVNLRSLLEDAPYIDDAGFSERVVQALPRRRANRVSYAVVPAFAVLSCHVLEIPAAHVALTRSMMWSFVAVAFALVLVASATLLPADD
jgi:hypothetical protein